MASISVDPRKFTSTLGPLATGWSYTAFGGVAVVLLLGLWFGMATPQTVIVDGLEHQVVTHRRTVGALLLDLGIDTVTSDRVSVPLDGQLRRGGTVVVERAQAYRLQIDGRVMDVYSWGERIDEVLAEAGLHVDGYDLVYLDADRVDIQHVVNGMVTTEPAAEGALASLTFGDIGATGASAANGATALQNGQSGASSSRQPIEIRVERSVPLAVHDNGMPFVVKTTAQTVGEALREAELTIYLGDRVDPGLSTPVSPGLKVSIQRSQPVHVVVGDDEIRTRTRADTVAEALSELRIGLNGADRVWPALNTPLAGGLAIQVTRVAEEIVIEEQIAPFDTVFVPDPNLAIDTQQVNAVGAEGITRTRYRVRYENGHEVERVLEDTWIAQDPANRVIAYGQRIEPRTMTTSDGAQITYWRHIQMHASSYSAGTAGVARSNPHYGRTRTGDRMRHGIVAVDPSIIALRSKVYVPGYGIGDALDTGSAIRSRRIDLGYDDSNLVMWSRWVDVYLLWPPPPSHQITWVIPNWPRPPQ